MILEQMNCGKPFVEMLGWLESSVADIIFIKQLWVCLGPLLNQRYWPLIAERWSVENGGISRHEYYLGATIVS